MAPICMSTFRPFCCPVAFGCCCMFCEDFSSNGSSVPAHALLPGVSEGDLRQAAEAGRLPESHYAEGCGTIRGRPAVIKTASLSSSHRSRRGPE